MADTLSNDDYPALHKSRAYRRAESHSDHKAIAVDWKRRLRLAIVRALVLADLTKQEASFAMGYPDQSAISKWIAGTEPTQWHKLMGIDQLRPWIPVAMAEQAGVEVVTTITVRRIA